MLYYDCPKGTYIPKILRRKYIMKKSKPFKIPAVGTGITAVMLASLVNKYIKNAHKASASNEVDDFDLDRAMKTSGPVGALDSGNRQITEEAEKMIIENFASVEVEENGTSYPITGSLTIGRYAFNDIAFANDGSVSRIHCRIFMDKGKYYIVDCNAKHVAKVNGQPLIKLDDLRPTQVFATELHDGDIINICDHTLTFSIPDSTDDDFIDDISTLSASATI